MFTHAYAKLPVQDVNRARRFYREVFELEPFSEVHGHMYYDVNGVPLLLFPSSGSPSGDHDQFGFVVDDLPMLIQRLGERGIQLEQFDPPPGATFQDRVMDRGFMKACWIRDSEGNLLSIAQFQEGSPFRRTPIAAVSGQGG